MSLPADGVPEEFGCETILLEFCQRSQAVSLLLKWDTINSYQSGQLKFNTVYKTSIFNISYIGYASLAMIP